MKAFLILACLSLSLLSYAKTKNPFGSPEDSIKKYEASATDKDKFYHLEYLSYSYGFEKNSDFDAVKAKKYMALMYKMMPNQKKDWIYGNAFHNYYIVMGRVYLREGQIDKARSALLKSCESPGSPQLNSGGALLSLFKEFFDRGDHEVNEKFLRVCKRKGFINEDIEPWIESMKKGEFPSVKKRSLPRE